MFIHDVAFRGGFFCNHEFHILKLMLRQPRQTPGIHEAKRKLNQPKSEQKTLTLRPQKQQNLLIQQQTKQAQKTVIRVRDVFLRLEKCSLNLSSPSFVIRVNLLHPCFFMVYHYYLFGVPLS